MLEMRSLGDGLDMLEMQSNNISAVFNSSDISSMSRPSPKLLISSMSRPSPKLLISSMSRPSPKLLLFLLILIAALLYYPNTLHAQYFGRNKVQYQEFDFKIMETEHFEIYYYISDKQILNDAALMLERWYERHAQVFDHQLKKKNPIIFYADTADFQQTNVISGFIGQGTGGLTEGMKKRVVIPLVGSYADIDHVIGHELVHVFQFDIYSEARKEKKGADFSMPLWFVEGMSEYLTIGSRHSSTSMWLRDAVLHEDFPDIEKMSRNRKYFPYRWGHALLAYIGGRWGDDMVIKIFKTSMSLGWREAFKKELGVTVKELSKQWAEAVRDLYEPIVKSRTKPEDIGTPIKIKSPVNISPSISPDGKKVAFFSQKDIFTIELFLADANSGKIIKKLSSFTREAHFDALRFIDSAGAWSPDNKRFAFIVFSEGNNGISIFDMEKNKIERTISFKDIDSISNPAWSPDGKKIAFTASKQSRSDLYVYLLKSGLLKQIKEDRYIELHPVWSSDGKSIAYATDRSSKTDFKKLIFGDLNIAIMEFNEREQKAGKIKVLDLFADANHINPQFSPDGKSLLFLSDYNGYNDIYRVELNTNRIYKVTDVATGISGISPVSPAFSVSKDTGRMIFSVFEETEYNLYKKESEDITGVPVSETKVSTSSLSILPPQDAYGQGKLYSLLSTYDLKPISDSRIIDYSPRLKLTNIMSSAIGVEVGGGQSTVTGSISSVFNDMLNDHIVYLNTSLSNDVNYTALQTFYLNRKRRVNWGVLIGHVPYYMYSIRSEPTQTTVNGTTVDAVRFEETTDKVLETKFIGSFYYPFSKTSRMEFNAGYKVASYERDVEYSIYDDDSLLQSGTVEGEVPGAVHIFPFSLSYVKDNSYFGYTSPMRGVRYNVTLGHSVGSLNYHYLLMDYRRYFFTRYTTFAFRMLHRGNYGVDAGDSRLMSYFLGNSYYMRGYSRHTFVLTGTDKADEDSSVNEYERLIGNRMAVFNFEARVPVIGSEYYGVFVNEMFPLELTGFLDAGVAWHGDSVPNLMFSRSSRDRIPVFSSGISLRLGVLNFLVFEFYYAFPYQHPDVSKVFGFQILPGW